MPSSTAGKVKTYTSAMSFKSMKAAKNGFVFGVITYGACQFIDVPDHPDEEYDGPWMSKLAFLMHLYAVCCAGAVGAMLVATYISAYRKFFKVAPVPTPFVPKKGGNVVDITPWRALYPYCGAIFGLVALISLALQIGSIKLFYVFWILWFAALLALLFVLHADVAGDDCKEVGCGDVCDDEGSDDSSSEGESDGR